MKKSHDDPHARREAERYEHPIPSRELILERLEAHAGPVDLQVIAGDLGLDGERDLEALRRRLRAMCRDGQLLLDRGGRYALVQRMDLLAGRVQGHRDGYGWLIPDDGSQDVYLHARQLHGALDGDRVLVRIAGARRSGQREGVVAEIVERAHPTLVGRLVLTAGVGVLEPANRRITSEIVVREGDTGDALDGEWVEAEMLEYPHGYRPGWARVLRRLGDGEDYRSKADVVLSAHDIPTEWPEEAERQAARLPDSVAEADARARIDLRDLPLVTIDGEDARDFDDAVLCQPRRGGGWRLLVAIADVSHYVEPRTPLDREAGMRGNSVYLPQRVVPMLPEALSNELCSLKPKVDRLCMVCEMSISAQGRVTGYSFYEGVMCSVARLTYARVGRLFEQGAAALADEDPEICALETELTHLRDLYRALRDARERRGAVDFESTEVRIELDAAGKVSALRPVQRNDAHKLIEECMIAANVCAARFLAQHDLPGLYRVHAEPDASRIENLQTFLSGLGLTLPGGDPVQPGDMQTLLERTRQRPDHHVIEMVVLRSMQQAEYQPQNVGHFGLALKSYAHFTSPIRRYADLLVHRAIRSVIRSKRASDLVQRARGARPLARDLIYPYEEGELAEIGSHISMTDRRAESASRDMAEWLKCEYMEQHLGADFAGTVTGVVPFGLFLELDDIYAQGLLHVSALPSDYYHFDEGAQALAGESRGGRFGLGDRLRVQVARVDVDERKIDFELLEVLETRPAPGRGKRARGQRKADGPGAGKSGGKAKSRSGSGGRRKQGGRRRR